MGDIFRGDSAEGDTGPVAPRLPDSEGNAPTDTPTVPTTTTTPTTSSSNGDSTAGILTAGIGGVGAISNLIRDNRNNNLERDRLERTTASPETREVAESTYRANREMMLTALQNFYAKQGWTMPTPGSGTVGSTSTQAVNSNVRKPNLDTTLPTDGTDGSKSIFKDATPEERARAATSGIVQDKAPTPNAQQNAAKSLNSVMPVNAKEAYKSRKGQSDEKKKTQRKQSKA